MSHLQLPSSRFGRLPVAAWALLVALTGLFANRASGSCGDYVLVGNPRSGVGMHHEGLIPFATDRLAGDNHDSLEHHAIGVMTPVVPGTPCQGPHCRQQPSEPTAPAPLPTFPPTPEAWVAGNSRVSLENSLWVEFPGAGPDVTLSRGGPFRPPRSL